jgi:uncharacterized 2Fe-2S/4Fe-4S cluster protein (DUF4445 family)
MAEVLLKIESEGREGVLAVGSYLINAAGRLGSRIEDDPDSNEGVHTCGVVVESGMELLSDLTEIEREQFAKHGRKTNERLACQTKFVKPGEIIIMTDEKKKKDSEKETEEEFKERFRKEFEEMPLEKKISNLVQLEFIALGETINFVLNSPYKVIDKVMDVMAEFGLKKDEAAKQANRPKEHQAANGGTPKETESKGKSEDAPAAG